MKHRHYYPQITISVLFGMLVGAISISPAYGGNIAVCQGTGPASNAKVSFAGRMITPSTILRTANGQACTANETGLNVVSLTHTLIVSPVGSSTQNGTVLLTAMTTISNSNPSANNPWLLKLEPGQYDLGNSALTLKPYVDLEGSGEGITVISSTVGTSALPLTIGTVVASTNSEVRFVTVANTGSNSLQTGLAVPSGATNVRVIHLTSLNTGGSNNYGLFNNGFTDPSTSVTVQDSTLTSYGSNTNNYGLFNFEGVVTVQNSVLSATGNGAVNYGLLNVGDTGIVKLRNSTLSATNGNSNSGLFNNSGFDVNIQNSTLTAYSPPTTAFPVFNIGLSNVGKVTVQNSILSGTGGYTSYAIQTGTETNSITMISASELNGGTSLFIGRVKCVASYNSNFDPLTCT